MHVTPTHVTLTSRHDDDDDNDDDDDDDDDDWWLMMMIDDDDWKDGFIKLKHTIITYIKIEAWTLDETDLKWINTTSTDDEAEATVNYFPTFF